MRDIDTLEAAAQRLTPDVRNGNESYVMNELAQFTAFEAGIVVMMMFHALEVDIGTEEAQEFLERAHARFQ